MLIEEFKRCIIPDVKSFLDERKIYSFEEAARLSDYYALTYKVLFVHKPNFKTPFSSQPNSKPNANPNYSAGSNSFTHTKYSTFSVKPKPTSENKSNISLSQTIDNGVDYPVCDFSKTFNKHQKKY